MPETTTIPTVTNLSTLGVKLYWAPESTAGTMPTTGYTFIPGITSIPEMNPAPDNIDVTDLSQTEYKQSVPGLKDLGGALSFGANLTDALISVWDGVISAYNSGESTGERVWFFVYIPKLSKSIAFPGTPSEQGLPAIEVNGALQTNLYITPVAQPKYIAKITVTD